MNALSFLAMTGPIRGRSAGCSRVTAREDRTRENVVAAALALDEARAQCSAAALDGTPAHRRAALRAELMRATRDWLGELERHARAAAVARAAARAGARHE